LTPGAVLLENEDLLVIDKPAGRDVIPSRDPRAPACLRDEWAALRGRVWVVHRLDRDTSGVLVFAKNPAAHRRWNAAFESRRVRKSYLAIVRGALPLVGAVVQPLREFGSGRVGVDDRGKPSETRFAVLSAGNGVRVVAVSP
jgi:tRNA pseudouridine32 synthase/23S rRNA pseudouridine746 synthase